MVEKTEARGSGAKGTAAGASKHRVLARCHILRISRCSTEPLGHLALAGERQMHLPQLIKGALDSLSPICSALVE